MTGDEVSERIHAAALDVHARGLEPVRAEIGAEAFAAMARSTLGMWVALAPGRVRIQSPTGILEVRVNERLYEATIVYDATGEGWPDR